MSVSEPGKIITPWAESGLKNPIPPAANPATGRAGFDRGFSAINMTAKEAGGIPPFGQDFNGIFYEVTNILRYMQAGGQPTFSSTLAAAIGGYPKGAVVLGSDGLTLWQSKVDSNSTNPNTDPSDWGAFDIGLKADLAAPVGAAMVGTPNGTVQDRLDTIDSDQLLSAQVPDTYGAQTAAIAVSRRARRTDNHVWFLGDSHGWGEGAPEYISIGAVINYSVHSSPLGNRGFIAQVIDRIKSVRGWHFNTYLSANIRLGGKAMTGDYSEGVDGTDPEATKSISLRAGSLLANSTDLAATRTRSCDKFFRPVAFGDTYSVLAYRDKVAIGRFAKSLMTLRHETVNTFAPDTKNHFAQLPVNPAYAAGAVGFTDVIGDGGAVIATRQTSSGITYLVSTPGFVLPYWASVGSNIVVPGYGLVTVQAQLVGGAIEVRNVGGAVPSADFMKSCHQGMRIYPGAYLEKALLSVDFIGHHSRAYIAVKTGPGYGKMRVYFTEGVQTGGLTDPFFSGVSPAKVAGPYTSTNASPQLMLVYSMRQDGSFEPSDPSVTIAANYVEIECATAGAEEVIYVIDFGGRTTGRLFIESVESAKEVGIRGIIFDNNLAINYAMGGHSVGAWLGEEASASGEKRDHIGDLLAYTPVRPASVVVQVPFVNEYLKQTPIATFKTRLQTLVTRINSHLPSGQNTLGTAYVFYTTLRNREIAFSGAGQSPVTYDMYVAAVDEFCTLNGHEFINVEDKLLRTPSETGIPFQRLYLNSNHPSDYTNMVIADEIAQHVMSIG